MTRTLIAGNWKMNGLKTTLRDIETISGRLAAIAGEADCLLCVPATLIAQAASMACQHLAIGGQTCHSEKSGAHTGDISAEMLADAGARYVIVGHCERRINHGERDNIVASQSRAALRAGLTPVICIGETGPQRESGQTGQVISRQLSASLPDELHTHDFVIAYEPVWAIGTGMSATTDQIAQTHALIRQAVCQRFGTRGKQVRLIYGGSMNPGNAGAILSISDVNGGLIGSASLKPDAFMTIYEAAIS